jgi:Zn-dependent protease
MMPTGQGALRLFRLAGINVYLHWSWFLVAAYEIQGRTRSYTSLTWNVLEYLSLFAIVTMHEFGHALACRSVGGRAEQIVLWPLGGVAYVNPPPRPGATLWSIAAGPLVNAVLFPLLTILAVQSRALSWSEDLPSHLVFIRSIWAINVGLLIFNLLPIYPLDGGQILRALLWFPLGRARSLMATAVIGFIGVAGLVALAVWMQSVWFGIMAAFILMNCWRGLQHARALAKLLALPRREGFACPSCKSEPPVGNFWRCGKCQKEFDTFETQAVCPQCGTQFNTTRCLECGNPNPVSDWVYHA